MSEVIEVSGDWLALREAEDARARSRVLAETTAGLLRAGPISVHDLGSGTGSMMRWLAPILPGPQTWTLHDWNAELTARAAEGAPPRDRRGEAVSIRTRTGELERLEAHDLAGASLVTASALLDLLTEAELRAIVGACVAVGAPSLLALSVTGEVELRPADPLDARISRLFNAHQQRGVDGRELLGPKAPTVLARLFARAGWRVERVRTEWRLDAGDPRLLEAWLDGWVEAAAEQSAAGTGAGRDPDLHREAAGYRRLRSAQSRRGDLSSAVAHVDLLAVPR